jgi:hypothetical protein
LWRWPDKPVAEQCVSINVFVCGYCSRELAMGFGRGALLWLLGIPLPIIILLALFWR